MPVTLTLEADGRILRVVYADPWSIEEMLAAFEDTGRYLDAATKPIHLLVDVTRVVRPTLGALRAREAPILHHPMGGDIAVFGANSLARAIAETVMRLARFKRAHFFASEAEALAYLNNLIAQETTA
ncbi:MAG: STAS/SEC14 domain-containing protein [Anaerolineae bacterium]|nr:STAS/SEC14 domain-containing protein [Anaerolineae bacterium]